MTRRVRFTPFTCARAFLVAGLAAAGVLTPSATRASAVPFAPAAGISNPADPFAVASADVDRDGDLDLLTGGNGRVAWIENVSGGSAWTDRTIATNVLFATSVVGADVDGDGDIDVVAATIVPYGVFWYENSAGNGSAWVTHTVATGLSQRVSIGAGDIDGDGDVDIVSGDTTTLRLHQNVAGNGSTWTTRTIATGQNFWVALTVGDMDSDGDLDVLTLPDNNVAIAWYDNLAGDGTLWVMRTVTTSLQGPHGVAAADLDRDGDTDIVAVQLGGHAVVWYENLTGNGQAWAIHTISTANEAPGNVKVADLDADGDLDVITADAILGASAVRWHENTAGNATSWVTRTVGTTGDGAYDAIVADLDGDGDGDVASVARFGNQIAWFRNQAIHETACFGAISTIFSTDAPFGSAAADIDRDGDLDVFSTAFPSGNVTWNRNEGGGTAWTAFTVATAQGTFIVDAADVDGDGDSDALIGSNVDHPASWIENFFGGTLWSVQAVSTPSPAMAPLELRAADIDGDGDSDALAPAFNTNFLSWYENQNGLGDTWLLHTVATAAPDRGTEPVDLDRDGDLDILTPATPLVWYENTAGNGSTWTRRTISPTGALAVGVLDLDGDGDLDVIASMDTLSLPQILWHENLSGNGTIWATHSLSTIGGDLLNIHARDLDGDGDLDIVANQGLASVNWLERTGPGVAFVLRTIATTANGVGTLSAPDLDGDGGPDVLWTSQVGDAVRWNRNGRGQVLLDALDQVPAGLSNGQVFPALRLTVTHGGRAGDSDLELARLGLLFEESPGDPLTSAQANALVEELRVYRDANGNGTFDPGIDVLVATVPTLSLTGGVQTVAFADGDPNVQVELGTPRTFFVVAQLTANASDQAPNVFRVTHLAVGPSATSAEDRNADIPLAIACPADLATVMIGPILPVQLMGFTVE